MGKLDIKTAFSYTFLLIYIYISGDSAWGATFPILRNILIVVATMGMTVICLIYHVKVKRKSFLYFFIICLIIGFSAVYNADYSGSTVILLAFAALLFTNLLKFEKFILSFSNLIFIISLASLIGLLLYNIAPFMFDGLKSVNGGGTYGLKNALITVVDTEINYRAKRNYGIFREPSVFATYIMVALYIELFRFECKRKLKIIVIVLALITTLSITGYLAFAVMLVTILLRKRKNTRAALLLAFSFLAGFIIIKNLPMEGYGTLFSYIKVRFQRNGASGHSINSRIASVFVNLYIMMINPIVGAGARKSQILFQEMLSPLGYEKGMTSANMITYIGASFGIPFFVIFTYGLFWFARYIYKKNNLESFLLGISLCICLCGQIHHYSLFPYFIIFYGFEGINHHLVSCSNSKRFKTY